MLSINFQYQMNTETWHVDSVSGPNPTYVQMIQMLTELSAIKIRAKYSNVSYNLFCAPMNT